MAARLVLDSLHHPAASEVVMERLVGGTEFRNPMVHSWDPQTRKIACGAPSQIGSTKHARDVTCNACLERLGRPPRVALRSVTR